MLRARSLVLAAFVPGSTALVWVTLASLVLAAVLLLRIRHLLGPLLRDGLRTSPISSPTSPRQRHVRMGTAAAGGRERPKAPS
jgi:hypothetical protein